MTDKEISAEFPYESKFIEVHGSNMHYVEQGEGDPVLFLHGNPTSSYLWRNIIPHVSPKARCIAPDLIGMGKSDKPDIRYGFFDHVKYVEGFIEKMGLANITFVIHDWGSALGFHYAMRHESNVKGLVFMEAIIKPYTWDSWPDAARDIFKAFRTPDTGRDLLIDKNAFVEQILPNAVARGLSKEEMDHYREPFLDPPSREPVWRWPNEIPIEGEPADVTEAADNYSRGLTKSELPKLLFFAEPGAIVTPEVLAWCEDNLKNLTTIPIGPGIHYIQEDNPHLIGEEIAKWYAGI